MAIDVSVLKGPLGELMDQLSGENGPARFEEFKLWLKKASSILLRRVTAVSLPVVARFVAADHFKKNVSATAIVRIGFVGDNSKKYLLGKIEDGVQAATLAVDTLIKASVDTPIRAELGERREITALAHLWELMKNQPNGENGVLLTNGYANIFYTIGLDGNVWAVNVSWYSFSEGWHVRADSVEVPKGWGAGCQVFSQVD